MFIAIEGIDGAGKATQTKLLAERLNATTFSFPDYETPYGKLIKKKLYGAWEAESRTAAEQITALESGETENKDKDLLNAFVLQSLMLTNRMERAPDIVKAVAKGNVVSDRYWISGYAYGKSDGLDPEHLLQIHRYLPQPDVSILLDIDVADSFNRRPERRELYERNAPKLEEIAGIYRDFWNHKRQEDILSWVLINARGPKEDTQEQISNAIAAWRQAHGSSR